MKLLSNKPSRNLNAQQNAAVFKMLQPNCKTLTTAVASLYFYLNQKWVKQFSGVLCFERDTKKKNYYLRFYRNCFSSTPEMVLQQRVKSDGVYFSIVRDQLFQMKIGCRSVGFQFVDSPEGYEESSEIAMALRGNMKILKREAEARYYEENPEKQKESRFRKIFRWRQKHKKEQEKPGKFSQKDISVPTDFRHLQHLGTDHGKTVEIKDWANDPTVRLILVQMGVEYEHVLHSMECRQRIEDMIKKHGGLESFRKDAVRRGFATQSFKRREAPASPQQEKQAAEEPAAVQPKEPAAEQREKKEPKKLKKQRGRQDSSEFDSYDSDECYDEPSHRDTPMPIGGYNWFPVDEPEFPIMPIWKPPTKEPAPAPTPPPPASASTDEFDEAWLKILADDNLPPPPPPVKRIHPPEKAPGSAGRSELLDEITQFNPTKTQKVPMVYAASTSAKFAASTPVTPAEALAIELNKTIEEVQALTKAEKRAKREKRGQQKTSRSHKKPRSVGSSSLSETTSDSDSDSDSDEDQSQQKKKKNPV